MDIPECATICHFGARPYICNDGKDDNDATQKKKYLWKIVEFSGGGAGWIGLHGSCLPACLPVVLSPNLVGVCVHGVSVHAVCFTTIMIPEINLDNAPF